MRHHFLRTHTATHQSRRRSDRVCGGPGVLILSGTRAVSSVPVSPISFRLRPGARRVRRARPRAGGRRAPRLGTTRGGRLSPASTAWRRSHPPTHTHTHTHPHTTPGREIQPPLERLELPQRPYIRDPTAMQITVPPPTSATPPPCRSRAWWHCAGPRAWRAPRTWRAWQARRLRAMAGGNCPLHHPRTGRALRHERPFCARPLPGRLLVVARVLAPTPTPERRVGQSGGFTPALLARLALYKSKTKPACTACGAGLVGTKPRRAPEKKAPANRACHT